MSATAEPIRVLHVDDDPEFGELAATFLEREDDRFEVETVTSAQAALDRLGADIDCIVSDHDMPGRTGLDLLETVREDHPDLPFILFTGKGSEAVASDAISSGVTDYLQKGTGTGQYAVLANRIENAVEQYRSQRDLEASRKRLSLFIEQSPLGVLEYNSDFEIVGLNDAGEQILGYTEDELRGETWEKIVSQSSYNHVSEISSALATAEGGYHSVNENVRKDGTRIVCEWHNRVVTDDEGDVVAIFSQFQDVTERKEREERLERTTARLEALFENSPDMIDIHTADGTIVDVNQRFCEVFDQTENALIGKKVWDIDQSIDPDDLREMWNGMEPGDRRELETEFLRNDGMRFPVKVHLARLPVDDEGEFMVISRDISARKQREQELRRYERMVNSMQESACIYDEDGRFVVVNEHLSTYYGVPAAELEGEPSKLIPIVRERFDGDAYQELLDGDRAEIRGEIESHFSESGRSILEYRLTPLTVDGEVNGVVGVARDVTERKTRERELERMHDLLDRTQRIANVGGWELDAETTELFWTENLFELLGVRGDEEPSFEEALERYHEADRPTIRSAIETALETGDPFDVEVRFRRPDGELRWIRVQGEPTVEDGDVVAVRGAVQDITERRERENELEQAREEYEELINGMNDTAWVIDSDESFLAVNDAAVETIGYSREELLSMSPHDIDAGTDSEEISALIQDMPEDGFQIFETVHETKEGEQIPVEISSSLISYQGETAILSIGRDISNRKERERRLQEFASVVSHDLRNPLNVAQGRLELARQECDSDNLDDVARAHDRMSTLIEDLLTLAREGGEIDEQEFVTLADIGRECWQNVATAEATLDVAVDRTVRADRPRLQQLLENLLRNAVEHGGEDVTVTIGELDDGFYVEDDGPGIPVDERADVTDAGYSTARDGTGFGLSIVTRVADGHGWDVQVTEGRDGRARFEITGVEFGEE